MIMYAKKKEIENMWTNLTKKDLINGKKMHWCGLFKRIILYTLLFAVLYICSNITMHIFTFWGLTYRNPSNTTFNIALFSFLVLLVMNHFVKKKESNYPDRH